MWASEAEFNDEDPRETQRRREAYARELDHQIALRRARQHQEQMEREEFERKLAPSERSPSRWLVEGGHLDVPKTSQSPWKVTQSINFQGEQTQDRGAATGEANSVSSSHPRFRVTDESETSQRLRERAQQMQWKRILDEQVQEKARLKQQEEMERRRSEEDVMREEVRYIREQQQRAQRRLGRFSPAVNTQAIENRPESNSPYHVMSSPSDLTANRQHSDFQSTANNLHNFAFHNDSRENEDRSTHYHRDRQCGSRSAAEALLPPPAPLGVHMPQGNGRNIMNDDGNGTFDRSREEGIATRQVYSQDNDLHASHQQMEQQSRIIDEYRSLLAEIRREREELRRERDEIRSEKEELRVQRALLQLENEKMASLVDAQRALNEQRQADFQTQQAQQAHQLAHQQQYKTMTYQPQLSPVQSVGLEEGQTRRNYELPSHQSAAPETEAYPRRSQIHEAMGGLTIYDEQPQPVVQGRRRKPPSPMSMADFSASTSNKHMTPNIADTPGFQRLSRYRPIPVVPSYNESVLNNSLVGESVFVPLSPKSQSQANKGPVPRATSSPTSADISSRRPHALRSSRVIKSRGFYDFEQEAKSGGKKTDSLASGSIGGSGIGSDLESSFYGDDSNDDGEYAIDAEDEESDHLDNSEDTCPAASSGLFQVQVLV